VPLSFQQFDDAFVSHRRPRSVARQFRSERPLIFSALEVLPFFHFAGTGKWQHVTERRFMTGGVSPFGKSLGGGNR
jgi:hypothetical protein